MASVLSQNQRCYVQKESSYGTIPNSGGAASVGNSDACRIISLITDCEQGLIDRPDKLFSLDYTAGIGGRKSGSWSASMSLAGSGSAGTAPDCDPFLEALFGKAVAIAGGTSCTYATDDTSPSLSIWDFRTPSDATQKCAFGSVVTSARFSLGGDVATMELNGVSKWVIDSAQFTGAETAAKGGLTAWPTEPASPTTAGTMVVGFTGAVTLDGNAYTTLRSATISFETGRELPGDVFNTYYPSEPAMDRRNITVDFSLYEDNSANLKALIAKAIAKTAVTLVFQMGTTAGNIWSFTLSNVLLAAPKYDDAGRKYAINFNGKAHASNATAKDAIALVIT